MLRDLGVRSKLLVLSSLPLLLVLALSSLIVGDGMAGVRAAERMEQLAVTSGGLNTVVHALQAERAATAVRIHT